MRFKPKPPRAFLKQQICAQTPLAAQFSSSIQCDMAQNAATSSEIDALYEFVYPLAIAAGDILLEGYHKTDKNVATKKAVYDVVTEYDTKIENFLMASISKVYPGHKFIGEEESAEKNFTSELTDAPTWIIDPIDGTANFIKKMPHTCLSIGLAINKQIVLGIVNNPITGSVFTARRGQGAFLNGQRISVSQTRKLTEAHIGYEVSLLHVTSVSKKHLARVYQLGSQARMTLAYGTVVMSLCYVACGALDAYHIEDMYPWDCAAGSLIVTEAGGVVYHTSGGDFQIMRPDLVCAGTAELATEMVGLIKTADQSEIRFESKN